MKWADDSGFPQLTRIDMTSQFRYASPAGWFGIHDPRPRPPRNRDRMSEPHEKASTSSVRKGVIALHKDMAELLSKARGRDDPNTERKALESMIDRSLRTAFVSMLLGELVGLNGLKVFEISLVVALAQSKGEGRQDHGFSERECQSHGDRMPESVFEESAMGGRCLDLWEDYQREISSEAAFLRNLVRLEGGSPAETENRASWSSTQRVCPLPPECPS